ncbi:MAG: S8 family serine peptidase [Planctomycetota bacterium]
MDARRLTQAGELQPVRVAILDSGINPTHSHLSPAHSLEFGRGFVDGDESQLDTNGHGTAVAAAILDLCPNVHLISVKIFDEDLSCSADRLVEALEYALTLSPRVDFVNLSLGSPRLEAAESFRQVLAKCAPTKIVAPATLGGVPSYPGALDGAIAVVDDLSRDRAQPQRKEWQGRTFWYASPYPRSLPGLSRARNLSGISFATANITGYLANSQSQT